MAAISVTYSFTNGTAADAGQVNTNFADIIAGTSDGTKDFSISAISCAGVATFNNNVILGNASGDDIQFNGSLATSIPIKTHATYNVGSSTLALLSVYFSMDSTHGVRLLGSSSGSANYSLTLPPATGAAGDVLYSTDASSTLGWKKDSVLITNASGGTSGVTLTTSSNSVTVFTPSAAITVKLDNSFTAGRQITIINNGTAEITLTANDDTTIATVYRQTSYTCLTPSATPTTNTSWLGLTPIISPSIEVSSLVSFTGLGTPADIEVLMKRNGSTVTLWGWVEAGTVSSTTMTMVLPSGIAINSSTPYETAHHHFGMWGSHRASSWLAAGDGGVVTYISGQGTDRVCFVRDGNADAWNTMLANAVMGNSGTFSFKCEFEVTGWSANKG